ncbi:MAG: trypsin-like peptidase domain-containing protein, partial [Victivallaceae bacterium]
VGLDGKVCPIQMGEPGDLLLGETVIVVGNPYGLGSSISSGVLSAIGRKITYQNQIIFGDILQTDAAVHPGNSGGPLINLNAEMIGINTAVLKGTQGIGFAVPLQRVENILARWLVPERFRNVSVGIIPAVNRLKNGELAFFLRDVIKDSPAWKAGLQPEMRVSGVDGKPLTNIMTLCRKLWQMKVGEPISLQFDSGKSITVIAQSLLEANGSELAEIKLGIGVQILSEELARALDYPFKDGLIISNLPDNTTSLERGDVLLQIDETTINSLDDIARALRHKRSGDEVTVVVVKIYQRYGRFYLKKKIEKLKIK